MSLERQYIQKFMNESKKQTKKFEESGFKYAYNTKDHAKDDCGYEVEDSINQLEATWDEDYGKFSPAKILIMKPATSIDKAMVCTSIPDGYLIYPSINAAINGPNGFIAFVGKKTTDITQEEIQELLQTKDLKRAKDLLNNIFDHTQNYGGFVDLYEYVSGPMPLEDGWTPGKILVQNKVKASPRDSEYYKRRVINDPDNLERVPAKFKTPEFYKSAVEHNGLVLKYVPDELKTPELCKIAVSTKGYALEFVPDELKTPELCKIAVEDYKGALEYVPDELKKQVKQELGIK